MGDKQTSLIEDCFAIDIGNLATKSTPSPAATIEWQNISGDVLLAVSIRLEQTEAGLQYRLSCPGGREQEIGLAAIQPGTGGARYFFLCPQCESRASKLYAPSQDSEFACRQCHNLVYASSRASSRYRTALRKLSLPQLQAHLKQAKQNPQQLKYILSLLNEEMLAVYKSDKPWIEALAELRIKGQ